ncbi:hypothetical protein TNCV_1876311 [Trichonephila clavipes]|nr:hypothetical protein TNCV_1876311 [Trichonephila clavipes]
MARSKHGHFKEGREFIEGNGRGGLPLTSRKEEHVALVSECVREGPPQTPAQIAEATYFSTASFEGIHSL